jgi:two-component system KDP operon response regulator KdpE
MARIQVVMRRALASGTGPIYKAGDLSVDVTRHQVMLKGQEITLTPTEFDLLSVLIQNAGKVVTHRQMIHQVWGTILEDESRLLRVNISNLRHKIEPNPNHPQYILTELGVGYRLRDA